MHSQESGPTSQGGGVKTRPPSFFPWRLQRGLSVFHWGSNPHNPPANFYPDIVVHLNKQLCCCREAARCFVFVSSYSFSSVVPRAQSFITVISASDHLPLHTIKCCSVVFDVTLRLLVIHFVVISRQKQTPVTQQRLVSSTHWSVAAKCVALRVHSTPSSQLLAQNRDFCLPHLHLTPR